MYSLSKLQPYAPLVLRLGLAAVFAWFGSSQLINPERWVGIVPEWATSLSGLNASTIVFLNGSFEILGALLLAVGLFVSPIALLLSLHLFVIATEFGLSPIGVRDFGLAFATLSLTLSGADRFCLQAKKNPLS